MSIQVVINLANGEGSDYQEQNQTFCFTQIEAREGQGYPVLTIHINCLGGDN